jgi:DNA-directed RNA polymerase specialized sigma24 family protein
MTPSDQQLNDLSTSWTLLKQAHQEGGAERVQARDALVRRYRSVVRRYLAGALRFEVDVQEAVDECEQRCWARLVEGRFRSASPERGRFRDYLRTVLANLVNDHRRERRRAPAELAGAERVPAESVSDEEYRRMYGAELLERAMERLRRQDEQSGQGFHAILVMRRDHADDSMEELAGRLSRPGQERTAGWVRTTLFRARQRLCELLRQEVAAELDNPTREAVDEELAELRLLVYCQQTR